MTARLGTGKPITIFYSVLVRTSFKLYETTNNIFLKVQGKGPSYIIICEPFNMSYELIAQSLLNKYLFYSYMTHSGT